MKFNPGQTRKVVNGIAYIKDISKTQVNPPTIEPKVEPVVIKTDDTVYVDSVYIYRVNK